MVCWLLICYYIHIRFLVFFFFNERTESEQKGSASEKANFFVIEIRKQDLVVMGRNNLEQGFLQFTFFFFYV